MLMDEPRWESAAPGPARAQTGIGLDIHLWGRAAWHPRAAVVVDMMPRAFLVPVLGPFLGPQGRSHSAETRALVAVAQHQAEPHTRRERSRWLG